MEQPTSQRWKSFIPSFVFLIAFGFALVGLNPTFFLDDSPETVTAALTLGIPHPPGYPLHTLLGNLLSGLSTGHWTFRVNLLSAALASAVSASLFLFLRDRLKISTTLSILFALFWIVGASAYPGALSAKTGIYHLTALFLMGLLGAVLSERWTPAAFFLGLSLTNHWMSVMALLPGLAWLAYSQWKKTSKRPNPVILLSIFCIGLSPYLFLPLRAHLDPLLNWGDSSSWSNFVFNFFREQYGGSEANGGPTVWLSQWAACGRALLIEFGGLVLVALFGWWKMKASDTKLAKGLGLAWIGLPLITGLYLNLPKDQYFLIPGYILASQVFVLIFAAWGTQWVLSQGSPGQSSWREKAALGILLLFLAGLGFYRYDRQRQTDYTATYDYVLNDLKELPRWALYFAKGDGIIFPGWYFQWIEGRRPDVVLLGVDGLPMAWMRKSTAFFHRDLKVPYSANRLGNESIPGLARWMVEHNPGRELYFSYNKIEDGLLPVQHPIPYGLTTQGFLAGRELGFDESRADVCWKAMRLRHLNEPGFPLDERTRDQVSRNYAIFRNTLGIFYEDRAEAAHVQLGPHSKAEDLFNIQSDYEKSLGHYQWAGEWDPGNPQFAFNTGNALFHLGRLQDSLKWYEKAGQLKKDYLIAYFNGAITAYQLGQYQKAGQLFQKVLDLKPDYAEARKGLDTLKQQGLFKEKLN